MSLIHSLCVFGLTLTQAPDERKELFDWLYSVGYREKLSAPLVKVTVDERADWGFMIEQAKGHMVVLESNLIQERFVGGKNEIGYDATITRLEMSDWAPKKLANVIAMQKKRENDYASACDLVALSFACHIRGLEGESKGFFVCAKKAVDVGDMADFVKGVKEDVADSEGCSIQWSIADKRTPWSSVLSNLREYEKRFPLGSYAAWVKQTIPGVQKIIADTRRLAQVDLKRLNREETIDHLILLLPNEAAKQGLHPGRCSVLGLDGSLSPSSPAHRLAAIGYPAVPKLLNALDDLRPTRCLQDAEECILTVGDVAGQILEEITKQDFEEPSRGDFTPKQRRASFEKKARAWWAIAKNKSERELVIEAVTSGELRPGQPAQILLKKYPKDAFDALLKAIKNSDGIMKAEFVQHLGSVKDPRVEAVLRNHLLHASELGVRVAAASQLYAKQPNLVVTRLIAEWKKSKGRHEPFGPDDLIDVLCATEDARAIEAIGQGFGALSPSMKFDVLASLGGGASWMQSPKTRSKADIRAYETALENFLGRALSNRTKTEGFMSSGGTEFSDPPVYQFAAYYLSEYWPKRYTYRHPRTDKEREEQRVRSLNTWRARSAKL